MLNAASFCSWQLKLWHKSACCTSDLWSLLYFKVTSEIYSILSIPKFTGLPANLWNIKGSIWQCSRWPSPLAVSSKCLGMHGLIHQLAEITVHRVGPALPPVQWQFLFLGACGAIWGYSSHTFFENLRLLVPKPCGSVLAVVALNALCTAWQNYLAMCDIEKTA